MQPRSHNALHSFNSLILLTGCLTFVLLFGLACYSEAAGDAQRVLVTDVPPTVAVSTDAPPSAEPHEAQAHAGDPNFVAFESAPVRPIIQVANRLIATNIPDNHIEVFTIGNDGDLTFERAIAVGLEPVAVAARNDNEVWVVNHLSDSVSVVDLTLGRVVRTLLVGDEPRDIVFGGPNRERAFITTAHRGQHRTHASLNGVAGAGDAQFTTPSVGRADVWVFDAANLGNTLGGTPLKIVELFGDTPRALAVTPDGNTVYAAIFNSGNQTAVAPMPLVCSGSNPYAPCDSDDGITSPNGLPNGQIPGGPPPPWTNHQNKSAPLTSLIVKFNNANGTWEDELGRNWSNAVRFYLPDLDVFAIDANTLEKSAEYAHVGTTLFNMVVNPSNGKLYISNTDANNEVRFEGAGDGHTTVQGDLARARVTVIDPNGATVEPRALNKHINYAQRPAPAGTKNHSLATPLDMTVSADGNTLYVTAFGSSKIGVLPTTALENDSFDPTALSSNYISVSGGGPAGIALNEAHNRLYVYTRFDNGISIVDGNTHAELRHITMHNPEPATVVAGRPMLYDAFNTSSNGEASCAACHIFGDMDHLAWDLGDPGADVTSNPLDILFEHDAERNRFTYNLNGTNVVRDFHPMKGPMLTQSLRGMQNAGAMHWRGDRSVGTFGTSADDERISFKNFIVAFEGLHGDTISADNAQRQAEMDQFADFALALVYPPNPNRNLDNTLTTSQANGAALFDGPRRMSGAPAAYDTVGQQEGATCQECHRLSPADGFYGTGGQSTFEGLTQIVKTAHLRNLYTRIGMFGMANTWLVNDANVAGNQYIHMGDQVRGYGFNHDGIYDTIHRFTLGDIFNDTGYAETGFQNDQERRDMEQFILAFDSDLAPIVGQQVTLDATNGATAGERIDLLIAQAEMAYTSKVLGGATVACDLTVSFVQANGVSGYLYNRDSNLFEPDLTTAPDLTDAALRALVANRATDFATYLCVPPGSGPRVALDRDLDGFLNGDEIAANSDPADALSTPTSSSIYVPLVFSAETRAAQHPTLYSVEHTHD